MEKRPILCFLVAALVYTIIQSAILMGWWTYIFDLPGTATAGTVLTRYVIALLIQIPGLYFFVKQRRSRFGTSMGALFGIVLMVIIYSVITTGQLGLVYLHSLPNSDQM